MSLNGSGGQSLAAKQAYMVADVVVGYRLPLEFMVEKIAGKPRQVASIGSPGQWRISALELQIFQVLVKPLVH